MGGCVWGGGEEEGMEEGVGVVWGGEGGCGWDGVGWGGLGWLVGWSVGRLSPEQ